MSNTNSLQKGGATVGESCLQLIARIKAKAFTALVSRMFAACGKGVVICPPFRFANLRYVCLEDGVMINRECWIHALRSNDEPATPKVIIGAQSSVGMGATISAVRRIVLGEHVLLARNVYISDHGHAFEDINVPIMLQGIRGVGEVTIGDYTWIGQNACILPGVKIGRHCVIGANSVVTRDLPDYCVAAGLPARIIKQYNPKNQQWEKVT